MADILWSDVTDAITDLPTISASMQTVILGLVNKRVDGAVFDGEDGETTKLARIFLAGHLAVMSKRPARGSAGPVTSESAGGLSRSYAQMTTTSALQLTAPGSSYAFLVSTSAARAPFVVPFGC